MERKGEREEGRKGEYHLEVRIVAEAHLAKDWEIAKVFRYCGCHFPFLIPQESKKIEMM
jgi:hypothetical protein